MEFRISQAFKEREKRSVIYLFLVVAALSSLFAWTISKGEKVDWLGVIFVSGGTTLLTTGARLQGVRSFLKYADYHKIEILPSGIISYELETFETLPWDKLSEASFDSQKKFLCVKTASGRKIDLRRYEHLDMLYGELKKYVPEGLWRGGL